jgi:hypothetical protein
MSPHLVLLKTDLEHVIVEDILRSCSWLVMVLSLSAVLVVVARVTRFRVLGALFEDRERDHVRDREFFIL